MQLGLLELKINNCFVKTDANEKSVTMRHWFCTSGNVSFTICCRTLSKLEVALEEWRISTSCTDCTPKHDCTKLSQLHQMRICDTSNEKLLNSDDHKRGSCSVKHVLIGSFFGRVLWKLLSGYHMHCELYVSSFFFVQTHFKRLNEPSIAASISGVRPSASRLSSAYSTPSCWANFTMSAEYMSSENNATIVTQTRTEPHVGSRSLCVFSGTTSGHNILYDLGVKHGLEEQNETRLSSRQSAAGSVHRQAALVSIYQCHSQEMSQLKLFCNGEGGISDNVQIRHCPGYPPCWQIVFKFWYCPISHNVQLGVSVMRTIVQGYLRQIR